MISIYNKINNKHIASGHRVGIVGGGQLAKMIGLSAIKLGCEIVILEKTKKAPSTSLAIDTLYGDWNDPSNLLNLANMVDVVSLENEFVDANSLRVLEEAGHRLYPTSQRLDWYKINCIRNRL